MKCPGPQKLKKSTFTGLVVLLFLVVSGITISRHEMWRDEFQPWSVARESTGIQNLYENALYDGHPGLWYISLHMLSRIYDNPVMMQIFHLLVAAGTVYIFVKFAPFPRLWRILFAFGYFSLYEYTVISRNYGIGIFLIFCFCAAFKKGRDKNFILLFSILALLLQTNLFGFMTAISLALMMIFECVYDRDMRTSLVKRKSELILGLIVFGLGAYISIYWMIPPADSGAHISWYMEIDRSRAIRTISRIWRSYFPIFRLRHNFWNTNILPENTLSALLSVFLLLFAGSLFVRKPVVFILFSVGTLGYLAFLYTKHPGYMRHYGHLYIMFIVSLWLANHYDHIKLKSRAVCKLAEFGAKYKYRLVSIILSAQLLAGIGACSIDLLYPFSASKNAAIFIKENQLDNTEIIGHIDYAITPLAVYLDRKIYYPRGDRYGSFIVFDKKRLVDISEPQLLAKADELLLENKKDVLIILNRSLKTKADSVVKLKEFTESIVDDEKYYLYLMKYNGLIRK